MKASRTLTVAATASDTRAACLAAVRRLGWDLEGDAKDGRSLVAYESPARLCCIASPVTVEVAVGAIDEESTALSIDYSVPGFGPVASNQLRSRRTAFEAEIAGALG